ncbi:MAG TPA: HAD family hydrolase [Kosmotoga arenicorallina]|uniref:HAD family hydrolase n=1 Tax=Kosmotoga arenicorallina TaxID=688066 RepID=A0A7C5I1Q5_9BACT|nr:HAD family hydrolase [Kosmotoga arenicorallina]
MVFCYLFDLDGTLTKNTDEEFITRYFGLIAKYVGDPLQMEKIKKAIFSSLEALNTKTDGRNNFDFFMGKFTKEMGYGSQERWADFFMKFYKTTYDELKEFVIPRGKMIEVLERLKEHGHKIVLATNPIFPSIAIEKRIFWIGLNPEIFDYITSMENSYNVKPSEKYYRYILEKVDCPPDRSFMIGNDSILDGGCVKAGIQFIDVASVDKIIDDMKN